MNPSQRLDPSPERIEDRPRPTAVQATGFSAGLATGQVNDGPQEIERLAAELERCELELERTRKALQSYLYVISHDLRQPLRTITAFVNLLAHRYHGGLDSEADEFIEFAVEGSRRCLGMLEALTSLSRVSARGRPLIATSTEHALDLALESLAHRLEASGAEVTRGRPLPWVWADPQQLIEVFRQLLDNAIRFAGDHAPRIWIEAARRDESWALEVRDAGIGIPRDQHERVLQVFRGAGDTAESQHLGLGLALCQRIVERHGGELTLRSAPGRGTSVRFRLLAATRPPADTRSGEQI